jgi:hypothetical protein
MHSIRSHSEVRCRTCILYVYVCVYICVCVCVCVCVCCVRGVRARVFMYCTHKSTRKIAVVLTCRTIIVIESILLENKDQTVSPNSMKNAHAYPEYESTPQFHSSGLGRRPRLLQATCTQTGPYT